MQGVADASQLLLTDQVGFRRQFRAYGKQLSPSKREFLNRDVTASQASVLSIALSQRNCALL